MDSGRVMTPKRLVLLLCLVSLVGGFALGFAVRSRLAGPPPPPGPPKLEVIFELLEVTPEQQPQVRAIFEKYLPRFKALLSEVEPRLLALRGEANRELATVLTPRQLEKLNEFQRAQDEAMREHRDR